MNRKEPLENRTSLRFQDAIDTFIKPMLLSFGYVQIENNPRIVRFASPSVLVVVRHEPYSYELVLTVKRIELLAQEFFLQDIVERAGGKEPAFFQASSSDRMFHCVDLITQLLKNYGSAVLTGVPKAFAQMAEVSDRRSEALTKRTVQQPVREAAELAWKQKHYQKVVGLYETIRDDLTPIEMKRLVYATNRDKGST